MIESIEEKVLPRSFYTREDATIIATDLLGKTIITRSPEGVSAGVIIETEAYMGPDDLACHAHSNRYTPRNKTMYEIGGICYVYICMQHGRNTIRMLTVRPHCNLYLVQTTQVRDLSP